MRKGKSEVPILYVKHQNLGGLGMRSYKEWPEINKDKGSRICVNA